jgi:hypothetical protein
MHQIKFRNLLILLLTAIVGLQIGIWVKTKPTEKPEPEKEAKHPDPMRLPEIKPWFDTGPVQVLGYKARYDLGNGGFTRPMTKVDVVSPHGDLYSVYLCQDTVELPVGATIAIVAERDASESYNGGQAPNGCHNLLNLRVLQAPQTPLFNFSPKP